MNTYRWAKFVVKHPIDFFLDFPVEKHWKKKILHAAIIILLAIVARVVSLQITGFALQTQEPNEVSVLVEAIWILVPWLTWSVASWGISTIVEGEGKFIDILTTSAFIFVPYIPLSLGIAGLSNLMGLSFESGSNVLYLFLLGCMYVWMLLMLFLHVKILHDFEFKRTFGVITLSVIGMFIVWFVGLLLFGLINQAVSFVITVYKEIMFRM